MIDNHIYITQFIFYIEYKRDKQNIVGFQKNDK